MKYYLFLFNHCAVAFAVLARRYIGARTAEIAHAADVRHPAASGADDFGRPRKGAGERRTGRLWPGN